MPPKVLKRPAGNAAGMVKRHAGNAAGRSGLPVDMRGMACDHPDWARHFASLLLAHHVGKGTLQSPIILNLWQDII